MPRPYRHIDVECRGDVFCVRLPRRRLNETEVNELADDLVGLIADEGCRKLALALGPKEPEFLYSVFLAKLVMVRRRLSEVGGTLKICYAGENVRGVFEACKLEEMFDFSPDFDAAVRAFGG
jgi:anti-anti-sigma factor